MDCAQQQRIGVRKYNKSEFPRLRWTPELHEHFVDAVRSLGGKDKATPKRIMQTMTVKGLKISHIKSHLQMYRSMKDRDQIDIFVRTSHLSKKQLHGMHGNRDRSRVFSTFSPQRQVGNELRLEWKDFKINEICCSQGGYELRQTKEETGKNKALQNQDSHGPKVNKKFGLNQFCGLSLSCSPPIMIPSEEERHHAETCEATHSRNISHSYSTCCTFGDIQDVHSIQANRINLDLTI